MIDEAPMKFMQLMSITAISLIILFGLTSLLAAHFRNRNIQLGNNIFFDLAKYTFSTKDNDNDQNSSQRLLDLSYKAKGFIIVDNGVKWVTLHFTIAVSHVHENI